MTLIITPKRTLITPPGGGVIHAGAHMELEGYFRLLVRSPRYGERVAAEFKNLIVNQGLDRFWDTAQVGSAHVGTGTIAPAVTQTGLASFSAQSTNLTATTTTHFPGATPYTETLVRYRFNPGVAVGTFSEVGMAWTSAPTGTLFSRALILDGGGVPTTVTVLSDETLDVEYRLRMYIPTVDVSGTLTLSGTPYAWTARAANSASWNTRLDSAVNMYSSASIYTPGAVLGPITAGPTGGTASGASVSPITYPGYVVGSYTMLANCTIGLASGNIAGGIQAITLGWNGGRMYMQYRFATPIPKDATKVLTFQTRLTWARRP